MHLNVLLSESTKDEIRKLASQEPYNLTFKSRATRGEMIEAVLEKKEQIEKEKAGTRPYSKTKVGDIIWDQKARSTKTRVKITKSEGGKWLLECASHRDPSLSGEIEILGANLHPNTHYYTETRTEAEIRASHPEEWCKTCKSVMKPEEE